MQKDKKKIRAKGEAKVGLKEATSHRSLWLLVMTCQFSSERPSSQSKEEKLSFVGSGVQGIVSAMGMSRELPSAGRMP